MVPTNRPDHPDAVPQRRPLVSVLVPCYNQAPFVVETLESIRLQTYGNIELIIVDDCSQDGSPDVIRQWIRDHDVRCEFLLHASNQGVCRTMNDALSRAYGEYVAAVAADDVWLPEKIERQVAILEAAPEDVGVVYSDAWRADVHGNRLPGMFIASQRTFERIPEGDIFNTLAEGNFIPALTALIRKRCFDRVGNYDERLAYEDWDMWLRIAVEFRFAFLSWPSGVYKVVPTSLVHSVHRGTRWMSSHIIMFDRCLGVGRLGEDQRRKVMLEVSRLAEQLYSRGVVPRHWCLWRAWRHQRSARMALMFMMSLLHLPYRLFSTIDGVHTSWTHRS